MNEKCDGQMEYPLNCSQIHALKGNTLAKTENKIRENMEGHEEPRHSGEKMAAMARGSHDGPWWCPWPGRGGLWPGLPRLPAPLRFGALL